MTESKKPLVFWAYKQKLSTKWHLFETLAQAERKRQEHLKEFHTERGFDLIQVIEHSAYEALKAQCEKLEEALKFYADQKNWDREFGDQCKTVWKDEKLDMGLVAEKALEEHAKWKKGEL